MQKRLLVPLVPALFWIGLEVSPLDGWWLTIPLWGAAAVLAVWLWVRPWSARFRLQSPIIRRDNVSDSEPKADAPSPQSAVVSASWEDNPLDLATDEQYADWYEAKVAGDPNWERALPFVTNGLRVRQRYEQTMSLQPELVGTKEHKAVQWSGYQRGQAVEVRGPFCPDDHRPLYHRSRIAPIDVLVTDDHQVGGMSLGELHCRDCDRTFDLKTAGYRGLTLRDPIERIGDCRIDVMRQFLDELDQELAPDTSEGPP